MLASSVRRRVAPTRHHQTPLQRMLMDARDQRIKKVVLVSSSWRIGSGGGKRLYGHHRPAHWNGCAAASTKWKALRLLNVVFSKPDETGWLLNDFEPGRVPDGARETPPFFADRVYGFVDRAARQPSVRKTPAELLTGNTGRLTIAVRHSSPSGSENRSPSPRTVSGASGNIWVAATKRKAADDRHSAGSEHSRFRQARRPGRCSRKSR